MSPAKRARDKGRERERKSETVAHCVAFLVPAVRTTFSGGPVLLPMPAQSSPSIEVRLVTAAMSGGALQRRTRRTELPPPPFIYTLPRDTKIFCCAHISQASRVYRGLRFLVPQYCHDTRGKIFLTSKQFVKGTLTNYLPE